MGMPTERLLPGRISRFPGAPSLLVILPPTRENETLERNRESHVSFVDRRRIERSPDVRRGTASETWNKLLLR